MTWDQARHDMDIPRLEALNRYWAHSPPVHQLVAQYLGIKRPEPSLPPEDQAQFLINLIDQEMQAS